MRSLSEIKVGKLYRSKTFLTFSLETSSEQTKHLTFFGYPSRNSVEPGTLCPLLSVEPIECRTYWLHPDHGKISCPFFLSKFWIGWEEVSDLNDHAE